MCLSRFGDFRGRVEGALSELRPATSSGGALAVELQVEPTTRRSGVTLGEPQLLAPSRASRPGTRAADSDAMDPLREPNLKAGAADSITGTAGRGGQSIHLFKFN